MKNCTDEMREDLEKCLAMMKCDVNLFTAGRRNDDAVNWCIAHYGLDMTTLDEMLDAAQYVCKPEDFRWAKDHIERVYDYVGYWWLGKHGNNPISYMKLNKFTEDFLHKYM